MKRRSLLVLFFLPFALMLPGAIYFGAVGAADHEMIAKIGLFRAVAEGTALAWTNLLNGGTLLLGSTSLPITPWDALNFVLPFRWAYGLALILHVAVAGTGFYAWRTLGRGDGDVPGLVGALTFQLSQHMLYQTSLGHEVFTAQYALAPWGLLVVDQLVRCRFMRFWASFPIIVFWMAMATYPASTIIFGGIFACYLLYQLRASRVAMGKPVALFLAAAALGLGLASFVYYPASQFARFCVLPGSPDFNIRDYAYHLSLPVPCLLTLVMPFFFGGQLPAAYFPGSVFPELAGCYWARFFSPENTGNAIEFAIYVGLVPVLLVFRERHAVLARGEGRFWFAVAVLLLLICLGRWGLVYPLFSHLPLLKNLRGPCRFASAFPLAFGALAVFAAEAARRRGSAAAPDFLRALGKTCLGLVAISAVSLVAFAVLLEGRMLALLPLSSHAAMRMGEIAREHILPGFVVNLAFTSALLLPVGLGIRLARIRGIAPWAVIACIQVADSSLFAYPILGKPSSTAAAYLDASPLADTLREACLPDRSRQTAYRHGVPHNLALRIGVPDPIGYKDFYLRWQMEFLRAMSGEPWNTYDFYNITLGGVRSPLLNLLRVKVIASLEPLPLSPWQSHPRVGSHFLYVNPDIAPEFYIPKRVISIADRGRRIERLDEVGRNPLELAVVESETDIPPPSPSSGKPAIRIVRAEPGRNVFEFAIDGPRPALLISALTFYPEWEATSAGRPLKIVRVNHAFLGVMLDDASNSVVLRFVPRSHRIGLWLSAAALVAWGGGGAGMLALGRFRRRMPPPFSRP